MEMWIHWRLALCIAIAGFACVLSLTLWRRGRSEASLPGCGAHSACEELLSGRWAQVGGVSVAGMAVVFYATMAVLLTVAAVGVRSEWLEQITAFVMVLAAGAGLWFMFLQCAILRRVCPYCTLVHVLGMAALVAWALPDARMLGSTSALMGCIGVAIFVVVQLSLAPKLHAVREFAAQSPESPSPTAEAEGLVAFQDVSLKRDCQSPQPSGRLVSLLGGRVSLNVDDWPRLGPADAEQVIGCIFDYTCGTCRRVHRVVDEAVRLAGGRLAVLLLPVPLDPTCNPHVTRLHALNAQACRYARLGMLMWQTAPAAYVEFDYWFFQSDEPPALGIAMRRAAELSGDTKMNPNQLDLAVDTPVAVAIAIYKSTGLERVPALLLASSAVVGEVTSGARVLEAVGISSKQATDS